MEDPMSNYEFWKELGKIFNAVVAYQEKSIEFNKRFINPWIKIGNVFDTQDRHREAVHAYQQAVEIDPGNAQNWLELGNAHFRNETFEDAVPAYQKAIELDPNLGWPYSNLAVTYVVQNRHAEAKLLYEKSILLLSDDKDKAICWNRLGNLHRKLNEYDLAMLAFQKADELDKENTGFKDEFDEVLERVEGKKDDEAAPSDMIANSIQLIVEQNQADEKALVVPQEIPTEVPTEPIQSPDAVLDVIMKDAKLEEPGMIAPEPSPTSLPESELGKVPELVGSAEETSKPTADDVVSTKAEIVEPFVSASDFVPPTPESETRDPETTETVEVPITAEKIETVLSGNVTETFTESMVGMETVTETFQAEAPAVEDVTEPVPPAPEITASAIAEEPVINSNDKVSEPISEVMDVVEKVSEPAPEVVDVVEKISEPALEVVDVVEKVSEPAPEILNEKVEEPVVAVAPIEATGVTNEARDQVQEAAQDITPQSEAVPGMSNVEAVVKGNDAELQPVMIVVDEPGLNTLNHDILTSSMFEEEPAASHEPIAMVDETGEFQLEMDTKNAHVWNELGNVYFNRGAIDDAVVAYSKAIELDRWFAWPYSNLALAYVQKERFAEAMLLYQRSIELFTSNKDKAISWNRLGNVYRRLNDYDNAIASYQRADELDPDNSTIYLQSRFSLLGNYQVEQNASLSS
jgi:tetratricopeptide (TPR) repeat protein